MTLAQEIEQELGYQAFLLNVGVENRTGHIVAAVIHEMARATKKFPQWPSDPLHAMAIVNEEIGELNKALLQQVYEAHKNKNGAADVYDEAIQSIAMLMRFLVSMKDYQPVESEQHIQWQEDGVVL